MNSATDASEYLTDRRVVLAGHLERVAGLAPLVAASAASAERQGHLDDAVVDACHDAGLYRILLAPVDGGDGLDFSDALTVFEAMAAVDGATGWNVCVGAIGMMLATNFLPPAGRAALVGEPRGLVAGGINPGLIRAHPTDVGCVFRGVLPFASGASHATWVLVGGQAWGDDGPVFTSGGAPVLVGGLVRPIQLTDLDTWRVAGLRGTGSVDLRVDDVFVPEALTFVVEGDLAIGPGGLALPFTAALGPGLSAVAIGIARHALEIASDLVRDRHGFGSSRPLGEQPDVQADLARARGLVAMGRNHLHRTWESLGRGDVDQLAELRLANILVAEHAVAATDLAFRAAGSASLYEDNVLERCWRDVHAVTKHTMVSHRHLARLGAIGLGLPPGPGFI